FLLDVVPAAVPRAGKIAEENPFSSFWPFRRGPPRAARGPLRCGGAAPFGIYLYYRRERRKL
ncbi:MAG TPA: hypothetical protein DD737_01825, partial [Ruminococcaceae bacterium]|nr:hypothetical protein [Oscillospiraceae bacterium]